MEDATSCTAPGCDRRRKYRLYCGMHYQRERDGRDMALPPNHRHMPQECESPDCSREAKVRGMCSAHYRRVSKGGQLSGAIRRMTPGEWGPWLVTVDGYVRRSRVVAGVAEYEIQHRTVMEAALGRALLADESVHHKNGDRSDNRLENLELWSRYQPSGQRAADKVAYAEEIIRRYGHLDAQLQKQLDLNRTIIGGT